jgi:AcrR family transcriptional regulator
MAQVKKIVVRDAILDAAFALFMERGYHETTVAAIAARANASPANIYVYFRSKLDILYGLYEPWLRERIDETEARMRAAATPREALFALLHGLWCDIPAADNGFANCLMQAISTAAPAEGYRPALLAWIEERVATMLTAALPEARRAALAQTRFAHVLVMAFDGYAIGRHLNPDGGCDEATIALTADLLLGG